MAQVSLDATMLGVEHEEYEWTGSVNERTGRIRMRQGKDGRGASNSIPIPCDPSSILILSTPSICLVPYMNNKIGIRKGKGFPAAIH